MRRYLSFSLLLLGLAVLASACAGPAPRGEEREEEPVRLSDFETFDVTPYRDVPAPRQTEIEHNVPDFLMEGKIERLPEEPRETGPRAGFRVQITLTYSRDEAERYRQHVVSWWAANRNDPEVSNLFPRDLPVYIVYDQPYFRVRVGNFLTRVDADMAVSILRPHFPDAWIVRDRVNPAR